MHSNKHLFPVWAAVFFAALLLPAACFPSPAGAASTISAVNGINVDDIDSFEEMGRVLAQLHAIVSRHMASAASLSFPIQKAVLTKSGECVTALVSMGGNAAGSAPGARQNKIALFEKNREIIKQILDFNAKTIFDYQENVLDTLDDPQSFFQSEKWQNPQYLISLASYWIGWNNYYASLYDVNGGAEKSRRLDEAIKGFSRAFVDFEEDAVVARSLFGRGLCYRRKKAFVQAMQDLELVKRKITADDPLYLRCSYEIAWILYETGKYREALDRMDEMRSDYTDGDIPDEIAAGLTAMRSKILIALADRPKEAASQKHGSPEADAAFILDELKKLSASQSGANELYRYARENADRLKRLPPERLGPIASIAVGDALFDATEAQAALSFYLPFSKARHVFLNDRMDGVWFRIAYTFCNNKKWDRAVAFLAPFAKKFPDSAMLPDVASLYYAAASTRYAQHRSPSSHRDYIHAIRLYLNQCKGACPYRSEAHFQLGKHYQKEGQNERAADQFNRVGEDSPNRFLARFYALKYYVDTLAALEKSNDRQEKRMRRTYQRGLKCLSAYRALAAAYPSDQTGRDIAPHMAVLSADLLRHGNSADINKALSILEGFETRYSADRPLVLKAMVLRVMCLYRLGMTTRMDREINRFIAVDTPDADRMEALHQLADNFYRDAESLAMRGRDADAEKPYAAALLIYRKLVRFSCNGGSPDRYCGMTLLRMASINDMQGRPADAEKNYLRMMEINPSSADAVYGLAAVYEKMKKWDQALAMWRKFSDGMAEGSLLWYESKYRISRALFKLGEPEKACDILTITMVLHPDLKDDALARSYLELKNKVCSSDQ